MNLSESQSVGKRFSAAADTYDVLATVQDRVAEELLSFIPDGSEPATILELGCGTGLLTRRLLKRFPVAHIDAVDVSSRMIQRAKESCGPCNRVTWHVADALRFSPVHTYSLIASNASLHWVADLTAAMRHFANFLTRHGDFVFSIMLRGTLAELRQSRQKAAPHKPPLRDLPEMADVLDAVHRAGLTLARSETQEYKITYRSAAAFLKAIHDQGVTGGLLSRGHIPLTRGEIENLIMEYEWHFHDQAGMVFATYKTLFVRASKGS